MASRLSDAQVAEIADIISSGASTSQDPKCLIAALQQGNISAFSGEELDFAMAALTRLDQPAEARKSWPASASRGSFFVFEGLDRSGKSTQSKLLAKRFQDEGLAVKWMCFPNRATAIGTLIDLYLVRKLDLNDDVVHLLFSANRWEMADSLVADLNAGTSVVCDRYAFSGVAYSAAKGLGFEWCQVPDLGLPVPDAIFFLHLDEKVGAARANFGDERYENATMQAAVRKEFQRPALRTGVSWHDIDAASDIESIRMEIASVVDGLRESLQKDGASVIPQLWIPARNCIAVE